MKIHRLWMPAILSVALIADQLSKRVALAVGAAHFNQGVSLGFSLGNRLLSIGLITVLLVLFLLWSRKNAQSEFSAWVIVIGAISNLIDRLHYGAVIDWFVIPGTGIKNNLADWFITIGVIGLLLSEFRYFRKKR